MNTLNTQKDDYFAILNKLTSANCYSGH